MKRRALTGALAKLRQRIEARLVRAGGGSIVELPDLVSEQIAVLPGVSSVPAGVEEAPRRAPALPEHRFAWALPPFSHTILVTTLEPSESRQADVSPILWWIACVRAHLNPRDRADLHAFVLLDERSQGAQHWSSLLERDDRFCRKLAWLVPSSPDGVSASAGRFLDRTFLAQPWADEGDVDARDLDPLADLAESLTKELEVPEPVLREWLSLLGTTESSGRDLAEELLRLARNDNET
jgi:hypothetical protein